MQQYFFALGKNPTLSLAEINAYFSRLHINYLLKEFSDEIAVISSDNSIENENVMKVLGGSVKFGIIIDKVGLEEDESKFQQVFFSNNLKEKYFSNFKKKLHFGISIYNSGDKRLLDKLCGQMKILCLIIKKNLQDTGIKAGFLRIKERNLSSVSVWKNNLLKEGVEIVMILTPKSILIGKTLLVQEFESFSFRDYGRPERDRKSGIIPPKLARIMINLSQTDEERVLLDPFCGSGTVIQEAVMLGHKNIIGNDISDKAVSSARKNIDWLFSNFRGLNRSSYNIKWWVSDVRSLNKKLANNSIDAVVTEPYLGPPLLKKPTKPTAQKIISELSSLYLTTFKTFTKILKPGGKIVIIFPVYEEYGKSRFLNIIDEIAKLGFEKINLIPPELIQHSSISLTSRGTILYGVRDHFVIREILLFRKKQE